MANLSLKNIYKTYPNGFQAVKDFNIDIEDKEGTNTTQQGIDELINKAGTTVTVTVQSLENGVYVEREVEIVLKKRPEEKGEKETRAQGLEGMRPKRP